MDNLEIYKVAGISEEVYKFSNEIMMMEEIT